MSSCPFLDDDDDMGEAGDWVPENPQGPVPVILPANALSESGLALMRGFDPESIRLQLETLCAQGIYTILMGLFEQLPDLVFVELTPPREWTKTGTGPVVEIMARFSGNEFFHEKIHEATVSLIPLVRGASFEFSDALMNTRFHRRPLRTDLKILIDPVFGKGALDAWERERELLVLSELPAGKPRSPASRL
jgi:hypothetical protein